MLLKFVVVLKSIRDSERHGSRHTDDGGNVIHQHVPYCSCHEPNCAAASASVVVDDELLLLLHFDAHCSTVVMLCFDDVYSLYGLVFVVVVPSSSLLSSREEGDHVIHPVDGDDAEFCT